MNNETNQPKPNCWAHVMRELSDFDDWYLAPPNVDELPSNLNVTNKIEEADAVAFREMGEKLLVHVGLVVSLFPLMLVHSPFYSPEVEIEPMKAITDRYSELADIAPLEPVFLKLVD